MADRKKKRKGARKTAASKPKADARVAAAGRPVGLPVGWELTVPVEGMSGTGANVPVPSDQPPPQRPQEDEAILRTWEPPAMLPQAASRTHNAPAPAEEFTTVTVFSESLRSPQSAGVETTVIRAAPEPSASVGDAPQGSSKPYPRRRRACGGCGQGSGPHTQTDHRDHARPPSDKGEVAPSGRCCRGGPEEARAGLMVG